MRIDPKTKPFVPWVGGKTALLDALRRALPGGYAGYFEPFVGGGALFFGTPRVDRRIISDANTHLMNAYTQVRDQVDEVIAELENISEPKSASEHRELSTEAVLSDSGVRAAALFIATLKTTWGAKWEIGEDGKLRGSWVSKRRKLCDPGALRRCSLHLQGVVVECGDYRTVLEKHEPLPGDFVYLDPPYLPENDREFTAYTTDGFDEKDHLALAEWIHEQTSKGVHVMLSMSDTPRAREIYEGLDMRSAAAPRRLRDRDGVGLDLIALNYYAPG